MVPVLIKMYKLIINELATQIEHATAGVRTADHYDEQEDEQGVSVR